MTQNRLTLAAVAVLTVVALVGVVVLTALGLPVPEVLGLVITAGLGALSGAALPLVGRASSRPQNGPDDGDDPAELGADALALVADDAPSLPRHLTRVDTGQPVHRRAAA